MLSALHELPFMGTISYIERLSGVIRLSYYRLI